MDNDELDSISEGCAQNEACRDRKRENRERSKKGKRGKERGEEKNEAHGIFSCFSGVLHTRTMEQILQNSYMGETSIEY